jgi:hypothetical protein
VGYDANTDGAGAKAERGKKEPLAAGLGEVKSVMVSEARRQRESAGSSDTFGSTHISMTIAPVSAPA